jgi:hypothetical protein
MFRKDGKLFGKISIVDIAAVLLIAALAIGIGLRFTGGSGTELSQQNTYECVVKVKTVRDYTVNALKKGGEVYDKTTKEYIGTIVNVTSEPASDHMQMADGTHSMAPAENRHHAYVTIAFQGRESADGYFTSANQQIGTGGTLVMNAKWAECEGTVIDVYPAK